MMGRPRAAMPAPPQQGARPQPVGTAGGFFDPFAGMRAMPMPASGGYGMMGGMPRGSYSSPYSMPSASGSAAYPGGYGGAAQGYGDGAATARVQSSGYGEEAPGAGDEAARLLTASGVPHDGGRLRWPVGLRVLAAPETDELRAQAEALFQAAAAQAADGPVNPRLGEELTRSVERLRRLLQRDKDERFALPAAVYDESEQFLAKLKRAETMLKDGLGAPGKARLEAEPEPAKEGRGGGYR
jgi:hypothetical protein